MIKSDQLRYIAGAYLSGKGYYAEISPEVPDAVDTPDILAVKPRARDVNLRFEKGGAPVGIIYLLEKNKWTPMEEVLRKTGFERTFVCNVLDEAKENGWVKSRVGTDGGSSWAIDGYRIPVSECLMVMCAADKPSRALSALDELAGCYDKGYLVFPYPVDDRFLHDCSHHNTGVMVFDEKIACFLIQLPAKRQKITKIKAYSSLCEKAVINHNVMISGIRYWTESSTTLISL